MNPVGKQYCISPMHLKRTWWFSYSTFRWVTPQIKVEENMSSQYAEMIKNRILQSTPKLVANESELVAHCLQKDCSF